MATPRYLPKAPITEALIDFRTPLIAGLGERQLNEIRAAIGAAYPTSEKVYRFEAKFEHKDGHFVPSTPVDAELGWMFRSADTLQVAQFRRDGFTFNRLRPYTAWEDVFPQAIELWRLFVRVLQPTQIARLAVRFINRLPRVAPASEFGLTVPPRVPPDLSLQVRSFLNRLVVYEQGHGVSAVVTQAVEDPADLANPVVLLDIDAFSEAAVAPDEDEVIAKSLGALRALKNEIFFASITEETARLYE